MTSSDHVKLYKKFNCFSMAFHGHMNVGDARENSTIWNYPTPIENKNII